MLETLGSILKDQQQSFAQVWTTGIMKATNSISLSVANGARRLSTLLLPARSPSWSHSNSSYNPFGNSMFPSSNQQSQGQSVEELFKMISVMRICVLRKFGSHVDTQITSIIDTAQKMLPSEASPNSAGQVPKKIFDLPGHGVNGGNFDGENGRVDPVTYCLNVDPSTAGEVLDVVQRQGLPLIFLNGDCIGGLAELMNLEKNGFLAECLSPHQFDLIIVGATPSGLAAAKEASRLGKKVAIIELGIRDQMKSGYIDQNSIANEFLREAIKYGKAIVNAKAFGWKIVRKKLKIIEHELKLADEEKEEVKADVPTAVDEEADSEKENEVLENGVIEFSKNEQKIENGTDFEAKHGSEVDVENLHVFDWEYFHSVIHESIELKMAEIQKELAEYNVTIFKSTYAKFTGSHEIRIESPSKSENSQKASTMRLTANKFLITLSLPQKILQVAGDFESAINSSDELLVKITQDSGKTLLICNQTTQHQAFEIASILIALGIDVTVLCDNSDPKDLSIFDQQMVKMVKRHLEAYGVKCISGKVTKCQRVIAPIEDDQESELIEVYGIIRNEIDGSDRSSNRTHSVSVFEETFEEQILGEFNTVSISLGSDFHVLKDLGLRDIGVRLSKTGKILGRNEQSYSMPNIYAIGELLEGNGGANLECVESVKLLMKKLYLGNTVQKNELNMSRIRTVPVEYNSCGASEEEAIQKHGANNLNVYYEEIMADQYEHAQNYQLKTICLKHEKDKIIGLHLIGIDSGKIIPGLALAMKFGAKKSDLDGFMDNRLFQ